ncbi:hypothetical protein POSPLADRAFT_1037584 [Postia placenta MAD-698-R-SB12]|uniref:C2 domain-containing protein n=1 Tax=Postia placenta MAD-698-R-SB12 TaxID=670580 RepID=A0A1X6MIR5_9APHY|nr:hypothetical protein POSPLADRAFT_1037584 [Postia placenta MAD-698-R-SB12]OSX56304.1 hypothetical protein POSPLADRAFT_1037584 [Postia placenta MAD-698-R-SB12]
MTFFDITVHFLSASGIPKMDVVGTADPYFVANLDDRLKYVSTVQDNTLTPTWDEVWRVKNVPQEATLAVEVLDKDSNSLTDGYIGQFSIPVYSGEQQLRIEDKALKRNRGTFRLSIDIVPSEDPEASHHPYTFDGPIRFSHHCSPTVGRIANTDSRLYSTWKVYIKGVRLFFGDQVQTWNQDYAKARSIFQGPTSMAVRSVIHTGHRMLYARTAANGFGVLDTPDDFFHLLHGHADPKDAQGGLFVHRIKPALYTYIIAVDDESLRFSETGARFLVNMASKHALHSNCAEAVRYSGEFHPRPAGGWESFDDARGDADVQWELVVDNKSGTYAPDSALLPALRGLLEFNFPGFRIVALDYRDPELKRSSEACRAYALAKRGVRQGDLQPHAQEGRETLVQRASNELHKHGISFGHRKSDAGGDASSG